MPCMHCGLDHRRSSSPIKSKVTGHYPCMFCGLVCKSIAGLKNHWRAAKKNECGVPDEKDRPHDPVTFKMIQWQF